MSKYNAEKIIPAVFHNIRGIQEHIMQQHKLFDELYAALLREGINGGFIKVEVAKNKKGARAVWSDGGSMPLTFEQAYQYGPPWIRYLSPMQIQWAKRDWNKGVE